MEQSELVRRCQQGDRQAMGLLYTDMHDELMGICRHYVTDKATAEDLLHDSFLLIFSKIGDLRSPEKARGWMHTVVKNVALLYVQRHQAHQTVPLDDLASSRQIDDPTAILPPFVTYDQLMAHVNALPQGYQKVFRLSVFEGMSHQQIGELLNIEPHSSSSQLSHAKSLLRRSLRVLLMTLLAVAIPVGIYHWMVKEEGMKNNALSSIHPVSPGDKQLPSAPPPAVPSVVAMPQQTEPPLPQQTEPKNPHAGQRTTAQAEIERNPAPTKEKEEDTTPSNNEETRSPNDGMVSPPLKGAGESLSLPSNEKHRWTLSLAYSGIPTPNHHSLPYGADGMNGEIDTVANHRMPLTIGLDMRYQVSPKLSAKVGLRYTLLSSDIKMGNTFTHIDQEQRIRYLGVMVGADYQIWKQRAWQLYGTASMMYELPLRSTLHTTYLYDDRVQGGEYERLSVKGQWSVGAGIGMQYDITPAVGLFAEPGVQYGFRRESGIETWRTLHPFTFSLPIGLRITF